MNPFSRAWVLTVEFVGLGVLCALLIGWTLRQRKSRQIAELEHITAGDVWRSLKNEVGRIFLHGDPAPTILAISLLTVAVGLKFALPMDVLSSTSSYAYLNRTIFNENTWGAGLMALGLSKLALLGWNSIPSAAPFRLSYYLGAGVNAFMALIWFNFAAGIAFSNGGSFGHLTYGMLSGLCLWASARRLRQGSGGS